MSFNTSYQLALASCALARECELAGDYEAAREAMCDIWQRVGESPVLSGLDDRASAEVLLRVGALSGWLGSTSQLSNAQEIAKDLITKSICLFESLGENIKVAEARSELAVCYWREGAFDESRVMLLEALPAFTDAERELTALSLYRLALIEKSTHRQNEALRILCDAAPIFADCGNHSLLGRCHNELGLVLNDLGVVEQRDDYIDRALVEFAAASYHFEKAGSPRYCAATQSNLGFLHFTLGNFSEAIKYLDIARRLFRRLNDAVYTAQVDEARARVLLAQGRLHEAKRLIRAVIHVHEKGDEHSLLTEALITQGTVFARLHCNELALSALCRAAQLAEAMRDYSNAGYATLTIIEELGERIDLFELRHLFEQSQQFLAHSQPVEALRRLDVCRERFRQTLKVASKVIQFPRARTRSSPEFQVFVSDASLEAAGICAGDVVKFRRSDLYGDGDLVAAFTPDGFFVAFIYFALDDWRRLEGTHPRCPIRYYTREEVCVIGVAKID